MQRIQTDSFLIELHGQRDRLWSHTVRKSGVSQAVAAPTFEVDGVRRLVALSAITPLRKPIALRNGGSEYAFGGAFADDPDLTLEMIFRVAAGNPVVRFCYVLRSRIPRKLTKSGGADQLTYAAFSLAELPATTEVRFSEFNEMVHSFCLSERTVDGRQFENGVALMGPMIVAERPGHSLLFAYEHGSQVPDAFVEFQLVADRSVGVRAVKGNYFSGQSLDATHEFRTIWFQFAATDGSMQDLAGAYRDFVLRHMTSNVESRKPYVFYNTWGFQERNKWLNGKAYLDSMNEQRMLAEIEVAHRMGIEVFVLDVGWFEKTGDWQVSRDRFPNGLGAVKAKLDGCGMKLGLWFDPRAAAVSSRTLRQHQDCVISWKGKQQQPEQVWETEASHRMCLVSRYADAFADALIRLVKELGVTYFKWDAIGQYGCDNPNHDHGDASISGQERADHYAFEIGRAMIRIVDRLCASCPEAIVDFDITEGHRFVGLGFLAAGKYFLINNGPYLSNYDIAYNWATATTWSNIFVHPGPARGWICRTPLSFDQWIPSVLFLTHYQPDDPEPSQWINIGSLILGQNGIWGDLLSVSEEGVDRFGKWLGLYKQVRDDMSAAPPVRSGAIGGSPEVHEKINPGTGRGAVVVFASAAGTYPYVTASTVAAEHTATGGVDVARDARGGAVIRCTFDRAGAKIVLFGAREPG